MAKNHYLAGVGRVLLFKGDELIGVAKTLTESSFNFSVSSEDIRGGLGNSLWGKYFHDSNLAVTLTDAMFNLQYIAASLGVNLQSGGLSVKEEQVTVKGSTATLTETAVAFDGSVIGWYKRPTDAEWKIGTIDAKNMTVSGLSESDVVCVKYFYQNPNAKSITIKSQYVPSELHVVIINDLYSGEIGSQSDATRYGRIITDIPRLLLDGNQDLSLTASGAATTSLSGNALAVSSADSCEEDPYYGTMTEEIFGAKWQDDVVAIAIENGDVSMEQSSTETLRVRVIFGNGVLPTRKDNSNFTFAIESAPANTATGTTVGASTGVIQSQTQAGTAVVSVTLKGATGVEPAYAKVTVK